MRAGLATKLVGLAIERLDVTDPAVRDHIQRLLAAQQEVERALAVLAQDLAAAGVAPEGVEADLEARVAELRDLQGAVLMATAAHAPEDGAA